MDEILSNAIRSWYYDVRDTGDTNYTTLKIKFETESGLTQRCRINYDLGDNEFCLRFEGSHHIQMIESLTFDRLKNHGIHTIISFTFSSTK